MNRRSRSTPLSAVALVALVALASLIPARALAQGSGEGTAMAEALFQQARDLVKQGNYAEACPKLAESQRLDPKLGTLLNLAVCHEKQGKIATAWAEYTSAAIIAHREGQAERESFARDQVAVLEKRLARVILQVGAPDAGLRVTLDDQIMAGAALGTPLPVDPGKHRIAATAAGKKAWSREVDVPAEKAEVLVPIPALEAAPEVAPAPPPPVVTAPAPLPPVALPPIVPVPAPAAPPARSDAVILMGTGFAVGGLGLIVGAITGGITLTQAGTIRTACNNTNKCGSDQQGAITSANTLANVSNVSFALAGAGVVVGVVGVVLRPGQPAKVGAPQTGVWITPVVGPGIAGLRGSF